jgi:hypothetical protein
MLLTKISATLCVLCVPIILTSAVLSKRRYDVMEYVFNASIGTLLFSLGALLISLIWGI